ncbi:putative sporulation transcription regulator WhiA [Clostridium tepidiprofundi DSM 19306]|uniref:Probable cell division protein WhiA n=1 Tax=Clostridium tepidiprofundi DSM 19306 TaxID=1121338 RepID=A0A151B6I5_9CLOT|nr:DNA-binding protein WhiA [Clostridium tepidiprofundi]KYH35390.1 putative sporulation transcription regulator WhiA [Clostridium tepidiprofundi DSM 19306]
MSFSAKVKREVCRISNISKEEARAILSGIMKVSGSLSIGSQRRISFKVTTENAAIARLIFKLLKEHFDIHTRLLVRRSNSLKKNNVYIVMITEEMGVRDFLREISILGDNEYFTLHYGIPEYIISNDLYKKAYIRGAFLGGGSISNPEKAYHLEFVTHNKEYADELSELVNSFNLNSKVIKRKNSYIVYLKEGQQIVDVLNIIGAHNSLLHIENVRIMKEMRNKVNRLVNCETANLNKTVNAAVRQIRSIKLIEKEIGLKRLPQNLREIAELRLKYPEISLKELGQMLEPPVGKSGINHRFRKIEKIANELRREN